MNANLFELFRAKAALTPDRLAILHRGEGVTYAELLARVSRRVQVLRRRGIGKGDRVVVFVPMSIALYEILLALFAIGAVAVFIDAWADARRLDHAAMLAEAKAFVAIPKAYLLLLKSRALRRIPVRLFPWFGRRERGEAVGVGVDCVADDPALVTFTTGSTGVPKAALRTCGFLLAQHRALKVALGLRDDDVDLATLPIFALNNLACGITTLIPDFNPARPAKIDAAKVAAEAVAAGVTTSTGSPAFFRALAASPGTGNPIPSLRALHTGGAAVFPEMAAELQAAFPGTAVHAVYGSTEAEPIAVIDAAELAADSTMPHGVPAGSVSEFIELALIPIGAETAPEMSKAKWRSLQVADGEPGEICVAGDHVLKTYFRSPAAVAENKVRVGEKVFHRTGDAGRLVKGRLFLLGRAGRVFRTPAGGWYFPALAEHAIQALPGVTAGTVVQRQTGEAVLVLESANESAAQAAAAQLDRKIVPFTEIRVVPHIPRDPRHASKLDYGALSLGPGYGEVLKLVWPLALGMANNALMQFTDRVFLAHESAASLEAVLPAAILAGIFIGFFQNIVAYAGTFVAQYFGSGNERGCTASFKAGLVLAGLSTFFLVSLVPAGCALFDWCGHAPHVLAREKTYYEIVVCGGVFLCGTMAAQGYFTGRGRTRTVYWVNLAGNALNIALDPLLIFGWGPVPALGMAGAAWATVLAQAVQFVVLTALARREIRHLGAAATAGEAVRVGPLVWRILRFGFPSGIYTIANMLSFTVFVFVTGKIGDLAFAVSNAAFSVNYLLFAPVEGFAIGASTLVGQFQGRGDSALAYRAGQRALVLAEGYVLVSCALVLLFHRPILGLFAADRAAFDPAAFISLGFTLFLLMAAWQVFDAADILLSGALKGAGDTRFVMAWMLVCAFLWLPSVFLVYHYHPTMPALWSTMIGYVFVISLGTVIRWQRGAWRRIRLLGE